VIVLLIKGLLLNTWCVLVDVLIAVRLQYRLSEAAVILYIISYITCQLNLLLTVSSGCDCSIRIQAASDSIECKYMYVHNIAELTYNESNAYTR
jgi:uncharacterized membrane protein YqjE